MTVKRLITIAAILIAWFFVLINAQDGKEHEFNSTLKNISIECEIGGERRYGSECLEPLKKFGKTVAYLVSGVIITIIVCCCGCVCCVCKIIHSNKNRTRGGVVIHRRVVEIPNIPPNVPVVATIAQ